MFEFTGKAVLIACAGCGIACATEPAGLNTVCQGGLTAID